MVRVIDEADADAVVLRNIERLYGIALGKAANAPLLDANILEELRYHIGAFSGQSHINRRRTRILVSKARMQNNPES